MSKFIEFFTKEVLRVLNFMPMNVPKYSVGIDSHVRHVLHLLQTPTNDDVKMIGIVGMGGIGKSTIAKAIYNHLIMNFQGFEGNCFVANISQEVSNQGHYGLVRLQEKLLRETLKIKNLEIDNVDEGISSIKARLQSKRVLIVLDDIDHISQLKSLAGQRDWFGWGSVVIITTRNVNLLRGDLIKAHEKYKIGTLSSDESSQLLSWHAFGVPVPPEEYTELSEIFVNYTGGLPLALTLLGSHLRGRSVEKWCEDVEKLGLMPRDDILKILKKSYDTLDDNTQSIFLDIACFFIGLDKSACFFIGLDKNDVKDFRVRLKTGIRTLIERCLLTIHRSEEKVELLMHPLIRDMAVEIVRKQCPQDPSRRSRLMNPDDVYDVIKGNKGTGAIEGMYVHSSLLKNESLSTEVLSKMKNLRLLKLDGVHLKGSFKHLPKKLRWFCWHNCPLENIPSDFQHEELEVLRLQDSNIRSVQLKMQYFKSLRILNLGGCEQLETTPIFFGAQSLQILSFKSCKNLVNLHSSIGCLESLIELDFAFCQKLKTLPDSICQLKSLEFLYLNDCSSLENIPSDLGKLGQLRKLVVHCTNIPYLPASLGNLRKLKILSVGWPKDLLPLPESESQSFDISRIDSFFPPTFGNLCSLEALYITYNHLRDTELIDLKGLHSLKALSLKGSYNLQSFPFSLCSLSRLESLELEECPGLNKFQQLPPSLLKISAKNCPSLRKIDISTSKRLKELNITNCNSLIELPGLESLDSIQTLDITNCSALTIPWIESCYQHQSLRKIDDGTERGHPLVSEEEVGNSREKDSRVQIHEIIEDDSPSREEQKTQFPGQDEVTQSEDIRNQFLMKVPQAQISPKDIMLPPPLPPRREEKKGPSPRVPAVAKKPMMDENTRSGSAIPSASEQIQKLHDEATRLVAEGSKLKWGILEFLDVALLRSKEEAMTPELSTLLNLLKVQNKGGYTTALEKTLCLLEALKNYEVERQLYQNDTTTGSGVVEMEESDPVSGVVGVRNLMRKLTIKGVDVSSDDSEPHLPTKKSNNNEGRLPEKLKEIDYDTVLELLFTPKKFEGLVVVKLGEAIEVTGTGMYSLKPGKMIQDDVINSYEFILRERAGNQPKCWYLPTYICQETQCNYSVKMYERNFQPYVTNSSCGIIYLPVFLNSHWYLVKANAKSRQAFVLDSYITGNQRQSRLEEAVKIMRVLHNLLKEHTLRHPTYQYEANFRDWEFEMTSWVPQQGNGVDCGAFVMLFMEMADQLTKHTGFNIDMERRRIALQLLYHPRNARLSSVLEAVDFKATYPRPTEAVQSYSNGNRTLNLLPESQG